MSGRSGRRVVTVLFGLRRRAEEHTDAPPRTSCRRLPLTVCPEARLGSRDFDLPVTLPPFPRTRHDQLSDDGCVAGRVERVCHNGPVRAEQWAGEVIAGDPAQLGGLSVT